MAEFPDEGWKVTGSYELLYTGNDRSRSERRSQGAAVRQWRIGISK